jgi:alkaline phosphatase D
MTSVPRRAVLKVGALAAAGLSTATFPVWDTASALDGKTFQHGVASGDPMPDGVLLWTRVTPVPEARPGSGLGPDVAVRWEVAADEQFRRTVSRGVTRTGAWRDHTVKVDATNLAPSTWYWYRFWLNGVPSRPGRTRTAPAAGSAPDRLRIGVVSCANWQAGYFASYRHLAARQDLDLALHLGDYLYEYAPGEYQARDVVVRPHDPPVEMTSLEHYRRRHAQYKTDPDLQRLHARVPSVVTWDDHESANDAWSEGAENHSEPSEGTWQQRRGFARQAYAEWMPVRYEPGGRLYRRLDWGTLAELSMLDLRSYRSEQVSSSVDPAIDDPERTITGDEQMRWLKDGLTGARAQWKLVGNPVMIAPVRFPSTLSTRERRALDELTGTTVEGLAYNVDQWDGYTADRAELFSALHEHGVQNTVFLTGDIHSAWAAELPADRAAYPIDRNSVGTELVCTSVTSDNLDDILRVPPRTGSVPVEHAIRANNPHVKHVEFDSHGFSVLEVTPDRVQMDWFELADRTDPESPASHAVSFAVPSGSQHVYAAEEALR